MRHVVELPLESGGSIQLEVEGGGATVPVAAPGQVVERLQQTFDSVVDSARACASALVCRLGSLAVKPQEIQVEFGLKVTASGSALIASAGTEGNFKVLLKWKPGAATPG